MSNSSIGPIDVVLLEFPEHTPTGEVAAELLAAADAGAIALYDIIATDDHRATREQRRRHA